MTCVLSFSCEQILVNKKITFIFKILKDDFYISLSLENLINQKNNKLIISLFYIFSHQIHSYWHWVSIARILHG